MNRRGFLRAAAGGLLVPLAAGAQPASKVPRIGFLATNAPAAYPELVEAFRQGLRDLGYVEGQNIGIEYRWAEGRVERFADYAAELVGLKVDVIVATSSPLALAARNATKTIPIVFVTAADPLGQGLVAAIARPGGNVTGFSLLAPEIVARQLQILKEAVPTASRVAVLSNPANSYTALLIKETEAAARSLRIRVRPLAVRGTADLDGAFSAVTKERPSALFVLFDPVLLGHRIRITEFANKNRLPAMYPHKEYAEAGGLIAYGVDLRDNFRRAATSVDKFLKGAKAGDLPVEQPTKFDLVINLKTAQALGLAIPASLLQRADQVIE